METQSFPGATIATTGQTPLREIPFSIKRNIEVSVLVHLSFTSLNNLPSSCNAWSYCCQEIKGGMAKRGNMAEVLPEYENSQLLWM